MMARQPTHTVAEQQQLLRNAKLFSNRLRRLLVIAVGLRHKAVRTSATMVRSAMTTAAEDLPHQALILLIALGPRNKAVRMSAMMARQPTNSVAEELPQKPL